MRRQDLGGCRVARASKEWKTALYNERKNFGNLGGEEMIKALTSGYDLPCGLSNIPESEGAVNASCETA